MDVVEGERPEEGGGDGVGRPSDGEEDVALADEDGEKEGEDEREDETGEEDPLSSKDETGEGGEDEHGNGVRREEGCEGGRGEGRRGAGHRLPRDVREEGKEEGEEVVHLGKG